MGYMPLIIFFKKWGWGVKAFLMNQPLNLSDPLHHSSLLLNAISNPFISLTVPINKMLQSLLCLLLKIKLTEPKSQCLEPSLVPKVPKWANSQINKESGTNTDSSF